ncbi:AT-rich interactive domain-containing protein 4B isoform X2 [Cephus cinctus]|uniref:AT-rich interactive domain-containing protein 4B isoform X2 n=1 Tax=Cephus cinctus TaxID=211228 RepID=A0AAJ7BHK0_CEPCN|nr:AT-rich interactive domain-containing protein 4B isoform X2 [Cephus cinctus]
MADPNDAVSEDTEREDEQPGRNAVIVPQPENEVTENQHENQPGNETTMAMLEDEEMPTFVTVSTPSRQPSSSSTDGGQQESESRAENRSNNSCHSDEQGAHSVCVISSGEESDHPPSDEEDDPEEDYDESDDMEEVDLEDDIEEEEEEEEDEEDTDGDLELDSYKRSCDDMILTCNNGIGSNQIGRSCSLQDISVMSEHLEERFHRKRYSMDALIEDESSFLRNPVLHSINEERRRSVPGRMKYRNVESKVKLYIRGIKEQNRQSQERRLERKNQNNNPLPNIEGTVHKPIDNQNTVNVNIKDYAERVIKDLKREELKGNTLYNHDQITENGEEISNVKSMNKKNIDADVVDMDDEPMENQKNLINCEAKTEKRNGTAETNSHNLHMENGVILNEQNVACFFNGQADVPALFNLRTVSYEEYMSVANPDEKPQLNMELVESEEYVESVYSENNMEEQEIVNDDDEPCALKIECVKSIHMNTPEIKENQNDSNFAEIAEGSADIMDQENSNISILQAQLRQKSIQFNQMQDMYEKTLAEKYELKRQLEEFKKVVLMYQKENERPEAKAVAVQTDILVNPISNSETSETRHLAVKLSTSSIGSTVSSNDPWADYSHSPAISLRPPSLTGILTSDESSVGIERTPRKTVRPLSRAFITSSRILQTLSSITQRKLKPDSPLANNLRNDVHDVLKDRSKNTSGLAKATYASSTPHTSSKSKKRKATEMLGTSAVVQPFKIPYTASESRRSLSSVSEMDGEFKRPVDHQNANMRPNLVIAPERTNGADNSEPSQETAENTEKSSKNDDDDEDDGNENGVKCIMYQEDENSKDRSFLIQAEENDKAGNAKGFVRECGPYLLGNVQVRMSEINGTINIWGKEVSQDSLQDNEEEEKSDGEEVDISKKPNDTRPCTCSQKASRAHLVNRSHAAYCANKKPKVPARFGEPSCSRNTRSPSILIDAEERCRTNCVISANEATSNCEDNNFENRLPWSNNKRVFTSRNNHSHCSHLPECLNPDTGSMHARERLDNDRHTCRRHSCNGQEEHRCSSSNGHNISHHWKHSCSIQNHLPDPTIENTCKHHTTCHRGVIRSGEEKDCQHGAKQYNSHENTDHCRSVENPCQYNCHGSNESSFHSPNSGNDEEDPLLSKRSSETPESRRRRLSGKRVRGILMDFFKGCGDCRSPSTSNNNKTNCHQRESYNPQIRITPCTPPQSMSFEMKQPPQQKINGSTSNRHCQSCNRRVEMTVEIESQLECFRVEMERLRSRSDAVLDMLNLLYSTDFN